MSLPVTNVTKPADLAGVTNGKLPASLLTEIEPGGKLHTTAARAWLALVAMCHAQGLALTWTKGGMYRTYAQQKTLFLQRYAVGADGGGCKNWDSDGNGAAELWCKKSSSLATAATPGTSNHGWGLAIDTAWDSDESDGVSPDDATYIKQHPLFDWFVGIVEDYGFSFELQTEPWHIHYFAGDDIPQAVLAFEAGETPTPTPPSGDFMQWAPQVSRGSFGPNVTMLQGMLLARGHSLMVDGQFGRDTENHVRWFQAEYELTVDGKVGPKTWHALAATEPKVDVV